MNDEKKTPRFKPGLPSLGAPRLFLKDMYMKLAN
jgi:hypothetical protein